MARIHRSFNDAPLIAARGKFPSLTDAEIITKALTALAEMPEIPSAEERQKAGQLAGGETTKRNSQRKELRSTFIAK